MKLARYHEENLGHFGLATEMYAHFTSPIRRYPDLVVHRALRALAQRRTGELPEREALGEMALHLSEMERRASEAERELSEWKKVRFMASKLGEVYQGYVTGVHAFGLFVELEEVYVQGLVHVSSMRDDYYRFDERAHRAPGRARARAGRRPQARAAPAVLGATRARAAQVRAGAPVRQEARRAEPQAAPQALTRIWIRARMAADQAGAASARPSHPSKEARHGG